MAERARTKTLAGGDVDGRRADAEADAERSLGRAVAVGLPLACVGTALVVGFVASVGTALLVLAAGALLGAIALLWASLRTLTGDAPLPAEMRDVGTLGIAVDALSEQKRRALRALKDIENEHALGRIDKADYESFVARYRDEAKALMRQMDERTAPSRAQAERMANEYVARRGGRGAAAGERARSSPRGERVGCPSCGISNEADAAFCKQCGAGIHHSPGHDDATT